MANDRHRVINDRSPNPCAVSHDPRPNCIDMQVPLVVSCQAVTLSEWPVQDTTRKLK